MKKIVELGWAEFNDFFEDKFGMKLLNTINSDLFILIQIEDITIIFFSLDYIIWYKLDIVLSDIKDTEPVEKEKIYTLYEFVSLADMKVSLDYVTNLFLKHTNKVFI